MKQMRKAISLWNRGHWKDYIFSQGMLLVAALLLVFFISIGLGVGSILQRFLSSDLPEEQVRVTPLGVQAGFFQTERGGAAITDQVLDSLEAHPLVSRIAPQIYAHVPAYLRGLLGGRNYYTDITLEGVTEAFVPDSILENIDWSYTLQDSAAKPLPIILSENLLILYNAGFAESNGLMGLTPEGVLGLECRINVGSSSLASLQAPPVTIRAEIVGTSRNMALFALAVPIEFVEQVNSMYLPDEEHTYSALMVTAEAAEDVPEIVRYTEAMGLQAALSPGHAQCVRHRKARHRPVQGHLSRPREYPGVYCPDQRWSLQGGAETVQTGPSLPGRLRTGLPSSLRGGMYPQRCGPAPCHS